MNEDQIAPAVSRALRAMREAEGITQGELAKRAGSTQASVSQYENGARSPTLASFHSLASALDVAPGDLFPGPDGDDPPALEEAARRAAARFNTRHGGRKG